MHPRLTSAKTGRPNTVASSQSSNIDINSTLHQIVWWWLAISLVAFTNSLSLRSGKGHCWCGLSNKFHFSSKFDMFKTMWMISYFIWEKSLLFLHIVTSRAHVRTINRSSAKCEGDIWVITAEPDIWFCSDHYFLFNHCHSFQKQACNLRSYACVKLSTDKLSGVKCRRRATIIANKLASLKAKLV